MAIRQDEIAAAAMGINTVQMKLVAFAIDAFSPEPQARSMRTSAARCRRTPTRSSSRPSWSPTRSPATCPTATQRRLEIARALATEPGLLLLDEPTAGMNPFETRATGDLVRKIRDEGLAVVVIEHDVRFTFNLCDRVAVLVQGQKLLEGSPDQVQQGPRVIAAYLGAPVE